MALSVGTASRTDGTERARRRPLTAALATVLGLLVVGCGDASSGGSGPMVGTVGAARRIVLEPAGDREWTVRWETPCRLTEHLRKNAVPPLSISQNLTELGLLRVTADASGRLHGRRRWLINDSGGDQDHVEVSLTGEVQGGRAHGTIAASYSTYNGEGQEFDLKCESGPVAWTAASGGRTSPKPVTGAVRSVAGAAASEDGSEVWVVDSANAPGTPEPTTALRISRLDARSGAVLGRTSSQLTSGGDAYARSFTASGGLLWASQSPAVDSPGELCSVVAVDPETGRRRVVSPHCFLDLFAFDGLVWGDEVRRELGSVVARVIGLDERGDVARSFDVPATGTGLLLIGSVVGSGSSLWVQTSQGLIEMDARTGEVRSTSKGLGGGPMVAAPDGDGVVVSAHGYRWRVRSGARPTRVASVRSVRELVAGSDAVWEATDSGTAFRVDADGKETGDAVDFGVDGRIVAAGHELWMVDRDQISHTDVG